jgi:hypothetical protein
MTKYEPLRTFLARNGTGEVPMRFSEIERVIGAPLPPVAFKHRAWWSNNPSNSVMTQAWLDAGYKTERVDMASQRLVFRRSADHPRASPLASAAAPTEPAATIGVIAALRGALGGTVRIADGVDLAAPTGEFWDADDR